MNRNEIACVHTCGLPHTQLPASLDAACLTASTILTASRAAEALCALMMLAPFCKHIAAAMAVAQSRSAATSCPATKGGSSQLGSHQHLLTAETVTLTSELAQEAFARRASQQGLLSHSPSQTALYLLEASHEAQIALHAFGKSNACRDEQTDCSLSQQPILTLCTLDPTWIKNDAPWLDASLLGMFCCSLQLLTDLIAHIAVRDVLLLLHCGRVAAYMHQNVGHAQLCHL